jgi:hypothetical protein
MDGDHEFISTEPEYLASLAASLGDIREPLADVDQQFVADGVTESVVYFLEPIEVEKGDRDRHLGAGVAEHAAQFLSQQQPIGQAGQRIIMSKVLELFFGSRLII